MTIKIYYVLCSLFQECDPQPLSGYGGRGGGRGEVLLLRVSPHVISYDHAYIIFLRSYFQKFAQPRNIWDMKENPNLATDGRMDGQTKWVSDRGATLLKIQYLYIQYMAYVSEDFQYGIVFIDCLIVCYSDLFIIKLVAD